MPAADTGTDWEHVYWEHRTCTECGAEPRDGDSVTHRIGCPRLEPEYQYPADDEQRMTEERAEQLSCHRGQAPAPVRHWDFTEGRTDAC